MLEELQTLALVGLLVANYFLTIGCRRIGQSLPAESTQISDKVADATEVLDDIADLLNMAVESVAERGNSQTPLNPMDMILSTLMGSMTSKPNHGNTLKEERTIYEVDSQTQNETQTESQQHSS